MDIELTVVLLTITLPIYPALCHLPADWKYDMMRGPAGSGRALLYYGETSHEYRLFRSSR